MYLEAPTTNHSEISNQEIFQGYSILKEKFGDKINLLYIKNSENGAIIEKFEDGKITKVSGDYKKYGAEFDWQIKKSKVVSIFCKIGINRRFYVCKNEVLRFLIKKLPISKNLKKIYIKHLHL